MAHLSTRNFHWQKLPRSFFAEISELPNKTIPLKRIFQDACDVGFTLVSEWTGQEMDFYMNEEKRDRNNDVIAWEFLPVIKGGPVTKVVILND